MSNENPLWGAPRIHGELLKLGSELSITRMRKWEHPYVVDGPRTKTWGRIVAALKWSTFLSGFASLALFVVGMFDVRNSIVGIK